MMSAPTPTLDPSARGPVAPPALPPTEGSRSARDQISRVVTVLGRTWRFRWYAGLIVLLGIGLSVVAALLRPRLYTSETLIIYREGIGTRTVVGGEINADAQQKLAFKLKEMVLSRTRLAKIIEDFHLYPALVEKRGYVDAVNELRKTIEFDAKDGETFGLSYTGDEPVQVQKLTARLAQELIEEQSKSRLEAAGETREFLDVERHHSDEDLKEKEGALATFLAKHPEFAREANGKNSGTETGIGLRAMNSAKASSSSRSSDPQLNALEREATRIQERLGMPTKKQVRDLDPKLAAMRDDAAADLKSAQRDLADKAAQFTEEHPDVRAAKSRLKSAEAKVARVNELIVQTDSDKPKGEVPEDAAIDRTALEAELKKVQDEITSYKRRSKSDPASAPVIPTASSIVSIETDWTRINREVVDARERNQQLEARQFRASILENAATSGHNAQMIVVDPAYKPTHPNRGRTATVIVGTVVAFVFAFLVALLATLLDDRIYDRMDLDALHLAPILGVVPRADGKKDNRG